MNTENCSYNVICVSNSTGNDILDKLDTYGAIYIDNINLQGKITISYDFTCAGWPNEPFVLIDKMPDHNELLNVPPCEYLKTRVIAALGHFPNIRYFNYPGIWDYMSCVTLKAHRLKFYDHKILQHPV